LFALAGRCGISESEFYMTTPRYFFSYVNAKIEAENERYKDNWERMRMEAQLVVQPHVKRKIKATDLIKFPWEAQGTITKEDVERIKTKFKLK